MCQPPHLHKCTVDFGSITSRCSTNATAVLFFKRIDDRPSKRCSPALAYSTEYCINVAMDNKVKNGLLIKSIKHVRLLKDSWIRNSLWKNVSLGELLPFFKKCLVFIQSTCVVTKHVGDKNLLWGSPEALSGAGISPIWSSGFGILKKIRGRDRDWNYAREVGYQK